MNTDFDLMGDGTLAPVSGRGGKREGAGRKHGFSPNRQKEMEAEQNAAEGNTEDVTATSLKRARALARKEEALAGLNELDLKVKTGQYLERDAFREAAATLLAELSQALRSLPDALERKHALSPEIVQDVEKTVDDALAALAAGLEMFTGVE